jgi:ACS family glucarate transporter-like MFS transporter
MPSGSAATTPATNKRWVMFSLACGASWFLYLHRYTWQFIRLELRNEYDFSNTTLQSLQACFSFAYTIGQIPSGILCDLFGSVIFLTVIIAGWSLVLPLFGLTSNVFGLGALRVAFGATQAGCYPNLAKVTRTWIPLRYRTTCQAMIASFFGRLGGAISPLIFSTLLIGTLAMSWRGALIVMSVMGLLFALVFWRLFRNSPEEDPDVNEAELELIREGDETTEDTGQNVLRFGQAIRNRHMLAFIIQQFMNAGADFIYITLMATYFYDLGFDPIAIGILASLPLFGGALGGIVGGVLNDSLIRRTGNRRWSRTAVGFTGKFIAAGVMLIAIQQTNGVMAGIAFFVVKFFTDWSQPTVWATCTDMGGRYSASVFSIINTAGGVGGMVMILAAGPILDGFTDVTAAYDNTEMIQRDYVTAATVAASGGTVMSMNSGPMMGLATVNAIAAHGPVRKLTNYKPLFLIVAAMYLLSALSWFFIDCTTRLDKSDEEQHEAGGSG